VPRTVFTDYSINVYYLVQCIFWPAMFSSPGLATRARMSSGFSRGDRVGWVPSVTSFTQEGEAARFNILSLPYGQRPSCDV
jgi:hypothetical protein